VTDLHHASTPPGPTQVRGGIVHVVDLAASALAMLAGGVFVESLMLAVAGRFTGAACCADIAVVAWQAVKRIDRTLHAWAWQRGQR
jgi:hypothetical protein